MFSWCNLWLYPLTKKFVIQNKIKDEISRKILSFCLKLKRETEILRVREKILVFWNHFIISSGLFTFARIFQVPAIIWSYLRPLPIKLSYLRLNLINSFSLVVLQLPYKVSTYFLLNLTFVLFSDALVFAQCLNSSWSLTLFVT